MYEPRSQRPISHRLFLSRLARHFAIASALLLGSLLLGMSGYMWFEGLAWRDAFLNSAMLLGGMGPVDPPRTDGGKLFAGLYALFAGLVFLFGVGILITPVFHRMMHKFHWDEES